MKKVKQNLWSVPNWAIKKKKKDLHFPEYCKAQCPYHIQNVQYTIQT